MLADGLTCVSLIKVYISSEIPSYANSSEKIIDLQCDIFIPLTI